MSESHRSTETATFPPGKVSFLPSHIGDGYNYGGGIIITFGEQSFNLGGLDPMHGYAKGDLALAHLLAAAPDLLAACERLRAVITDHVSLADVDALDAAIAKAKGGSGV